MVAPIVRCLSVSRLDGKRYQQLHGKGKRCVLQTENDRDILSLPVSGIGGELHHSIPFYSPQNHIALFVYK